MVSGESQFLPGNGQVVDPAQKADVPVLTDIQKTLSKTTSPERQEHRDPTVVGNPGGLPVKNSQCLLIDNSSCHVLQSGMLTSAEYHPALT